MAVNDLFVLDKNQPFLGDIVTYSIDGGSHTINEVRNALAVSGLSIDEAPDLHVRNAFIRACKDLQENRIIKKLREDADYVEFQFNNTYRDDTLDVLNYDLETILRLDKTTGKVSYPDTSAPITRDNDLLDHAQKLILKAVDTRTGRDISSLVQRLFKKNADLFHLRNKGGAYFVPAHHAEFVGRVEDFMARLGYTLSRFPVPKGTYGDKHVKDAIVDGLERMIKENLETVDGFDPATTREDTLKRMAERVKAARFKIEAYAEFVGNLLDNGLAELDNRLNAKIDAVFAHEESTEDISAITQDGEQPALAEATA